MLYKNSLISFSLVALLGFTTWVTLLSYRSQNSTVPQETALPDAFMEDVNATFMDKQGKPNLKIITPKMTHYPKDDTTDLTSPELTLFRNSPEPWHITSKYAKATQGTTNVHFWEDVVIHHPADLNNPATVIKTTTLTVHPNEKTAETADPITMIQPNSIIKAIGMHANLNSGEINLLSQARGEYVPDSSV